MCGLIRRHLRALSLFPIFIQDDAFHLGAGLIVDRVGDVLILAILAAATRHGHARPGLSLDDLEAPDDKAVRERDARESLEFCVLSKRHSYFSDVDLHRHPSPQAHPGGNWFGNRYRISMACLVGFATEANRPLCAKRRATSTARSS